MAEIRWIATGNRTEVAVDPLPRARGLTADGVLTEVYGAHAETCEGGRGAR